MGENGMKARRGDWIACWLCVAGLACSSGDSASNPTDAAVVPSARDLGLPRSGKRWRRRSGRALSGGLWLADRTGQPAGAAQPRHAAGGARPGLPAAPALRLAVLLGAAALAWTNPGDGPAYPSLYRYPYLVQIDGAWPEGFEDGQLGPCPDGTRRHDNGGGCATEQTPASVYVGPYARVLGGEVRGDARIEDQATVARGTVAGGTVGGLSIIGTGNRGFTVSGAPTVRTTFLPLGWFGGSAIEGDATVVGDVEFNASVSGGFHFGLVDGTARMPVTELTTPPPYSWRP